MLTAATALTVSAGGLGVFGYWLLHKEIPSGPSRIPDLKTTTTRPGPPEPIMISQVESKARGGPVEMVVIRPEGVDRKDIPVCLALHGRGSNARMFVELGAPAMLNAVVAAGKPPFAIVSLDGGDSYWVGAGADDPQRMLDDELSEWLEDERLAPYPFAVMGISAGAYGALNYARSHPRLGAVVAISPALFTNWNDAKARGVFPEKDRWDATDPLRHMENLKPNTLAVWCGSGDGFAPAARQLATKVKALTAVIGPGGHDAAYWTRVLPDVLGFVGAHL